MRLAQVYGEDVQDLLIKDYIPEVANSIGDWETVTFNNTLDMATGNYGSADFMADDNSEKMGEFFSGLTFADRIIKCIRLGKQVSRWYPMGLSHQ